MKIYVASSWRNMLQQECVSRLRAEAHEVYDFRNPFPGDTGFHWSEIDQEWKSWDASAFRASLDHPIARRGFANDWEAMKWAQAGVLLLPCGRSAHLEAGYFVGAGKPLWIVLSDKDQIEPELMYRMGTGVVIGITELCRAIRQHKGA